MLHWMLHGSETWAPTSMSIQRLIHNDRLMICWICGFKNATDASTSSIFNKLGLVEITHVLSVRRLPWYGHVKQSP